MTNIEEYNPNPIILDNIHLDDSVVEAIARNIHEVWTDGRLSEGWTYGEERNDEKKQTPCLVPYDELPEIEKEYDRRTAKATISALLSIGYQIKQ